MTTEPTPGLLRDAGFRRLWIGETTSQFGSQFALLAIPVIAVELLAATELQVGLLTAAETAAFLVIGLPAGAWIDRLLKRRVMMAADLVRAAALAVVPVLWAVGALSFGPVVLVAVVVGIATVFFDVSYQSYVPVLVPRERIGDANSRLESTVQIARIAGPAAAGGLLAIVAAPLVLIGTAATYLASLAALSGIRDTETLPPRSDRRPLRQEIAEGLRFVVRERLLFRIVLCTGVGNLFATIATTMLPVLVLRELDLSPAVFGAAIAVGAVGGVAGAAGAARLGRRIGEGTVIPVSAIALGAAMLLLPLMAVLPGAAVPLLATSQLLMGVAVLVYNVTQVSFRQRICPPRLLGRMNASIRFLVWGVMPIGALVSGALSTLWGVGPTVLVGAVGTLLSAGFVVFSPLRGLRRLPGDATAESGPGPAD